MKKINLLFLALGLFLTAQTHGSTDQMKELCPKKLLGISNIQINQKVIDSTGLCYLSIHPRDAFETLVYRDYLLTSEGLLMVFNSLKPDDGPGSAGAREFFFFQDSFQGYQWEVISGELVVTGLADLKIHFSLETSQITSIEGAEITLDENVNADNGGGFELIKSPWTFLDTGFYIGNTASSQPQRFSVLKNASNNLCKLRNRNFFVYTGEDPKVKSKLEIQKAASLNCPGFVF